jgi:hypothetical protein
VRVDHRHAIWLLVLLGLLGPVAAYADVITEERAQCLRHQAGDACESGECVPAKCSAGGRPGVPRSEYDCVVCAPRDRTRLAMGIGIAAGVLALAGGLWFAKRRKEA